jgi:hypothetical protein
MIKAMMISETIAAATSDFSITHSLYFLMVYNDSPPHNFVYYPPFFQIFVVT